ncbi:MAG: hypothetical protein AAFY41_07590 [Bacteroidota bacterium]
MSLTVHITKIEIGAMYEGNIHNRWISGVTKNGKSLKIFDSELLSYRLENKMTLEVLISPLNTSGDIIEVTTNMDDTQYLPLVLVQRSWIPHISDYSASHFGMLANKTKSELSLVKIFGEYILIDNSYIPENTRPSTRYLMREKDYRWDLLAIV